jgi:hypothetical protein
VLPLYHLEKVISWGILNPYVPVYCTSRLLEDHDKRN